MSFLVYRMAQHGGPDLAANVASPRPTPPALPKRSAMPAVVKRTARQHHFAAFGHAEMVLEQRGW